MRTLLMLTLLFLTTGVLAPFPSIAQEEKPEKKAPKKDAGDEAEPLVKFKTTRIMMPQPEGFAPSSRFAGFVNEAMGATIQIEETHGPIDKVTEGFTKEYFRSIGLTLDRDSEIPVGKQSGRLYQLQLERQQVIRWLLVFGDEKDVALITATFPKAEKVHLYKPMRKALTAARWDTGRRLDPMVDLDFTLDLDASLGFAHKSSDLLFFTPDGAWPRKSNEDPLVIIEPRRERGPVSDLERFSRSLLTKQDKAQGVDVKKVGKKKVDNLRAIELVGKARDPESLTTLVIYQVVIYDDDGYYRFFAMAGEKDRKKHVANWTKMFETFKRKTP